MFLFKRIAGLPFGVLYLLADGLYLLFFYLISYRKKVIIQNLRRSFPEKNDREIGQLTKDFYRNLADIMVETVKALTISQQEMHRRVQLVHPEIPRQYVQNGQPVLLLTSHQCNWEWVLLGGSGLNMPIDAIYKPLHNAFFDRLMLSIRTRFGAYAIPIQRTLREVVRRKDLPRGIATVADQMPDAEHAYWTTFLHQDTGFFTGTERIARSMNYPVVFVEVRRVKRGFYALVFSKMAEPPYDTLPPNTITERYVQQMERAIRANPADWLWSHKRWKHKRVFTSDINT
ncbi:MAG: lysophospholipid acyltransferase family protein [Bacteroidota bacterium]